MNANDRTPSAPTAITRQDFIDFFRSENGWADLMPDDRLEIFMDILQGDAPLHLPWQELQ